MFLNLSNVTSCFFVIPAVIFIISKSITPASSTLVAFSKLSSTVFALASAVEKNMTITKIPIYNNLRNVLPPSILIFKSLLFYYTKNILQNNYMQLNFKLQALFGKFQCYSSSITILTFCVYLTIVKFHYFFCNCKS